MDRRLFIVIAVVAGHVLGLWALQNGLLRKAVELVVPVSVLADVIEPPEPQVPPAPPPLRSVRPVDSPTPRPQPATRVAPQPVAIADSTPAPEAPTGITTPQPPAPPPSPVAVASSESHPTPSPLPPPVELPSKDAEYLNNPQTPYPTLSKRLGEQGKVVVRAFIETNGTASKAEIRSSSGYERLDQAALQAVLKWRYVPGKRAGRPEAMWFNMPFDFALD